MLSTDAPHIQEAQVIPYSRFLDKLAHRNCLKLLDACAADLAEAKRAIRERLLKAGWTEAELG